MRSDIAYSIGPEDPPFGRLFAEDIYKLACVMAARTSPCTVSNPLKVIFGDDLSSVHFTTADLHRFWQWCEQVTKAGEHRLRQRGSAACTGRTDYNELEAALRTFDQHQSDFRQWFNAQLVAPPVKKSTLSRMDEMLAEVQQADEPTANLELLARCVIERLKDAGDKDGLRRLTDAALAAERAL